MPYCVYAIVNAVKLTWIDRLSVQMRGDSITPAVLKRISACVISEYKRGLSLNRVWLVTIYMHRAGAIFMRHLLTVEYRPPEITINCSRACAVAHIVCLGQKCHDGDYWTSIDRISNRSGQLKVCTIELVRSRYRTQPLRPRRMIIVTNASETSLVRTMSLTSTFHSRV